MEPGPGQLEAGQRQDQRKWGDLTDDDLTKIEGNREQFEGALQSRYGQSKEAARKEIDDWLKTLH